MMLASSGSKSQSNGGDNVFEGKVGEVGDGVEEEVGGRRKTVKLMIAANAITKTKATYYTPYRKGGVAGPGRHWHRQGIHHPPMEATM
jgi:hypothetical protein